MSPRSCLLGFGALALLACDSSDRDDGSGGSGAGSITVTSATTSVSDVGSDASSATSASTGSAAMSLDSCPTTGKGSISAVGPCFAVTPATLGASAEGDNADALEYLMEPSVAPKDALFVELNGSGGTPAGQIADPALNIYNAAAGEGYHVIGLAYRSGVPIGGMCSGQADCFGPTRETIVRGDFVAGASLEVDDIVADESIVKRLAMTLDALVAARPGAGWDSFIGAGGDDEARIVWGKIVASGHSQGGGHAAMMGKLFSLRGVLQLSSTCDAVGASPAPWTDGSTGSWATDPATKFIGLAAPTEVDQDGHPTAGDTICPGHVANWNHLGMSPGNMHDDAETCGHQGNTHGASIGCTDNFARWGALIP